jgi:hypothetical protein
VLCRAVLCQEFMVRLSEVVQPKPASLTNYRRMHDPCNTPELQVQPDTQLSRVAFYEQVQVSVAGRQQGLGVGSPATCTHCLLLTSA